MTLTCMETNDLKEKFIACKLVVKNWEDIFKKSHGTKPSKEALSEAPEDIKDAYKFYWKYYKKLSQRKLSLSQSMHENITEDSERTLNLQDKVTVGLAQAATQDNPSSGNVNKDLIRTSTNEFESDIPVCNIQAMHNKVNSNVWGGHLNKSAVMVQKKGLPLEASLYTKIAEKMRNNSSIIIKTRKSLNNFSRQHISKLNNNIEEKETINAPSLNMTRSSEATVSDTLPAPVKVIQHDLASNSYESGDNSQLIKPSFLSNTEPSSLFSKKPTVKKKLTNSQSQSISLLSQNFSANNSSHLLKKYDSNWLSRCSKNNLIDSLMDEEASNLGENILLKDQAKVANQMSKTVDSNMISKPIEINTTEQFSNKRKYVEESDNTVKLNCKKLKNGGDYSSASQLHSVIDSITENPCNDNSSSFHTEEQLISLEKAETKAAYSKKVKNINCKEQRKTIIEDTYIYHSDEDHSSEHEYENQPVKKSIKAKCRTQNKNSNKKHKNITLHVENVDENINLPNSANKEYNELLDMENSQGAIRNSKPVLRRNCLTKEERLQSKMKSGKINENFVKINLKKKVFVRGQKRLTCEKYKRQEWKKKKLSTKAENGDEKAIKKFTCFRCGVFGHWANKCPGLIGDSLMPVGDYDENESIFLSLDEAADLARGIKTSDLDSACKLFVKKTPEKDLANAKIDYNDESDEDLFADVEDDITAYQHINGSNYSVVGNNTEFRAKTEPSNNENINMPVVPAIYQISNYKNMPSITEIRDTLKLFGHNSFRNGQEETILRILSGQSTLLILSTGSGKSLCYQLPAYIYALHHKCITICVSPLVSLMEDQVTGLPSFLKAVCLHTQQTPANREKALTALKSGSVHILLVSPEAIVSSRGGGILGTLLRDLPPVAFACIDEAHCLSEWSHNFRPSYLQVCKVLKEKLKVHTLLGLTATARKETALSIAKHLQISDINMGVISGSCIPDNLMLSVSRDENREEALMHLLTGDRFSNCSSIIVYCTRREECERVATFIRTQLITASKVDVKSNSKRTRGISLDAEAYHAGLSGHRRQLIQKKFMNGTLRIVVATVAFGMGIDKSDVQGIIHFNMTRNLESYVQEIGRAGRDGRTAHCHLFLDSSDGRDIQELKRHIFINSVDRFTVRKLLNKLFKPCACAKIYKLSTGLDEDENTNISDSKKESTLASTARQCPGHEVTLIIDSLIELLDIPEENIQTLLCYLELNPKNGLKLGHHVYATCNISCYKGPKQLCSVSRLCPPLAAAIAMQRNSGTEFEKKNRVTFPVVEIASQMGWDSGIVKQELKRLEWSSTFGAARGVSSGVKVEFCDLAFHLNCRGDFTEEEQDEMLEELYKRACKQERDQLKQLQYTYDILRKASHATTLLCCDTVDEERCSQMKKAIREYFSSSNEILDAIQIEEKLYIRPELEQRVRNDVRSFISTYSDQTWTGRSVARVLHGISSPNVPAQVWGKVRRFWRLHLDIDFNLLVSLATKEILKYK